MILPSFLPVWSRNIHRGPHQHMMAASSAEMDLNKVHYLLKRARAPGGNRRRAAERDGKSNTWDVYVSPRETSARIKPNSSRYRILCHSRSRKPNLKHVFKDFQLRKTVMEFYERKHRQEPAPSLSCWEWVKFTIRMGGGGGTNLQEVDKFYIGNHQAGTLQLNNVSQADGTQRPSQRSDAQETLLFWKRVTPPVLSIPAAISIRTMRIT